MYIHSITDSSIAGNVSAVEGTNQKSENCAKSFMTLGSIKICKAHLLAKGKGEVVQGMSEEIDILIERKEAELLPLRSRMEKLRLEFIKETVDFASKWYRKTAKVYITKYPEVILSLSEEQIANMKAKVNELVRNSEKIVKDELDNPALWWHQKPHLHDSIDQYKQIADKYPEILDHAVRHALGHLGIILEEFRFHVTASGNIGAFQEFWFERPIGSGQTIPYFPHLLEWTEEMQDTIREYNAQFTEAITLYDEIQKLKEEKKRLQALTRWDSA